MTQDRFPLTRLTPAEVARRVLVVGDPGRAAKAAELLEGARTLAANREYVTYGGSFEGRRVCVTSHGVGAAGAGLAFEELARGGARVMIRAGTCGAVAGPRRAGTGVTLAPAGERGRPQALEALRALGYVD